MPFFGGYQRESRRIRGVRLAAVALGVSVLALAAIVRFVPEWLPPQLSGTQPLESAGLPARVESTGPSAAVQADTSRAPSLIAQQQVQDTTHRSATDSSTADQDTNPPPHRRRTITDVVLLPCSTANPRPDGSFVLPPHNPRHRTIVGLPSAPGEPRRGFVIPPHDPTHENRVPIRVISMDSILEQSLQVPAHDPSKPNIVRPYAVPCLADSTGQ